MIYSIVGLLFFIFWVWMLIDCIKNQSLSSNERIVWVLVIIFLSVLGAPLYFFLGRGKGSI